MSGNKTTTATEGRIEWGKHARPGTGSPVTSERHPPPKFTHRSSWA